MEIAWGDWSLLDNRPRREDTGTTDDRGEKAGATLTAPCKEAEGCWDVEAACVEAEAVVAGWEHSTSFFTRMA